MKSAAVILIVTMLFASALMVPTGVQASEKEYKELIPTLVHTGTMMGNIACWGNNLAWPSGRGNITFGRASGTGMTTVQGDYWSAYGDLAMSADYAAWSGYKDYEQANVYYSTPVGGGAQLMGTNTEKAEDQIRLDAEKILFAGATDTGSELRYAPVGGGTYTVLSGGATYDISGNNIALIDSNSLKIVNTAGTIQKDLGHGYDYQQIKSLRISGDYLVYYNLTDFGRGANVYVKNWKTGATDCIIFQMEGFPSGLDLDGNFVAFTSYKSPELGLGGSCVFIYDIQAKTTFQVSPEYSTVWDVAIGGGRIAWMTDPETATDDATVRSLYTALLPEPGQPPAEQPELPADVYLEDVTLNILGTTRTINVGEGISFTHKGVEHALTLDTVTSAGVTITVYSDPQSLTLSQGQTVDVDTDGNGKDDLSVKLDMVDELAQTAVVVVSPMTESSDDGGIIGLSFPGGLAVLGVVLLMGLAMSVAARRTKR